MKSSERRWKAVEGNKQGKAVITPRGGPALAQRDVDRVHCCARRVLRVLSIAPSAQTSRLTARKQQSPAAARPPPTPVLRPHLLQQAAKGSRR